MYVFSRILIWKGANETKAEEETKISEVTNRVFRTAR